MNFRKSSERPLTPLHHFRKVILRFSRQNCDKSAYVHTHCSETIFNPNVRELTVFFHIIIFHIYMDYFIAFLKYFTDVRVKKCPFCTQQWLKTTFEWPKVVSEVSVICIAKCFHFFVSVIGNAVSEI